MKFLAIDFETANCSPDSACAVGLADDETARKFESGVEIIPYQ